MLFSFWDRPWVKKIVMFLYSLVVIISSVVFCYWTFKFDTDPTVLPRVLTKKVMVQTSCKSELLDAQKLFERDPSPNNWKKWADLEQGCKNK